VSQKNQHRHVHRACRDSPWARVCFFSATVAVAAAFITGALNSWPQHLQRRRPLVTPPPPCLHRRYSDRDYNTHAPLASAVPALTRPHRSQQRPSGGCGIKERPREMSSTAAPMVVVVTRSLDLYVRPSVIDFFSALLVFGSWRCGERSCRGGNASSASVFRQTRALSFPSSISRARENEIGRAGKIGMTFFVRDGVGIGLLNFRNVFNVCFAAVPSLITCSIFDTQRCSSPRSSPSARFSSRFCWRAPPPAPKTPLQR